MPMHVAALSHLSPSPSAGSSFPVCLNHTKAQHSLASV